MIDVKTFKYNFNPEIAFFNHLAPEERLEWIWLSHLGIKPALFAWMMQDARTLGRYLHPDTHLVIAGNRNLSSEQLAQVYKEHDTHDGWEAVVDYLQGKKPRTRVPFRLRKYVRVADRIQRWAMVSGHWERFFLYACDPTRTSDERVEYLWKLQAVGAGLEEMVTDEWIAQFIYHMIPEWIEAHHPEMIGFPAEWLVAAGIGAAPSA